MAECGSYLTTGSLRLNQQREWESIADVTNLTTHRAMSTRPKRPPSLSVAFSYIASDSLHKAAPSTWAGMLLSGCTWVPTSMAGSMPVGAKSDTVQLRRRSELESLEENIFPKLRVLRIPIGGWIALR